MELHLQACSCPASTLKQVREGGREGNEGGMKTKDGGREGGRGSSTTMQMQLHTVHLSPSFLPSLPPFLPEMEGLGAYFCSGVKKRAAEERPVVTIKLAIDQ